jgi:2,5-dihydroxypyridine 5,6-dioxygenase
MFPNEYELGKASKILVEELLKLKPGENIIITADTESDPRVVHTTASAAFAVDAKPMVIWTASGTGIGKVNDPLIPSKTLTAALKEADVWVEFNNNAILYSTPFDIALKENLKLRYLCLPGMNSSMMTRCIGRINFPILKEFMEETKNMIKNSKHVRITTPAGGDVDFIMAKMEDEKPTDRFFYSHVGYADVPGVHMMAGQIGLTVEIDSVNGKIVFDGSLVPPCGILKEPVSLTIESGKIMKIEGGEQAKEFEKWLKSFNHPQMLKLAHLSYGFNPGAKLTGDILEDERVWGATEWGIGQVSAKHVKPYGIPAPSHTDGICLNSSVWLDNKQIMEIGEIIEPKLGKLAQKLGKS